MTAHVLPDLVDYTACPSSALYTICFFFPIIGSLVYTNRPMQWHAYRDLPLTAGTTPARLDFFTTDVYILAESVPQRPSRCISKAIHRPTPPFPPCLPRYDLRGASARELKSLASLQNSQQGFPKPPTCICTKKETPYLWVYDNSDAFVPGFLKHISDQRRSTSDFL